MPIDDKELNGSEEEDDEKESDKELEGFEEADKPKPDADKDLEGFEEAEAGDKVKPGAAVAGALAGAAGVAAAHKVSDVHRKVEYITRQEKGFGAKLKDSVVGVLVGLVLFIASFFILYKGETRVDRSEIVRAAVAIQPDQIDKAPKGKAVKFAAKAATTAPVTDPEYLPDGKFLHLSRRAEMFAWVERSETEEETVSSTGKTKTVKRTTTYHYTQEWTSDPADSSRFDAPTGHENPAMTVESKTWFAQPVSIGGLSINLKDARILGADQIPEPVAPKLAETAKPFDPSAPTGEGPVAFAGVPAAAKPAESAQIEGKQILLYTIKKETYGQDGKWSAGATTIKAAEGITVGKVKINTANLKAEGLPEPGKVLYKPKTAAEAPVAGNERATVQWIELGAKVTTSGKLAGDTLSDVTISGKVPAETPEAAVAKSRWYIGKGSPSAPQIGDIRLSFAGIKPDAELFVCGDVQGQSLAPTMYKGVAFLLASAMPENNAIAKLQSEHTFWTWLARIGGFLCMWIGMCLMVGPLTFLVGHIPVLGDLAGGLIHVVFGIIALVLTTLTILLIRLFWVILILVVVLVVWAISKSMRAKPAVE